LHRAASPTRRRLHRNGILETDATKTPAHSHGARRLAAFPCRPHPNTRNRNAHPRLKLRRSRRLGGHSISCRSIVASQKPIVALYGNPDLMQAPGERAIGIVSIAQEMLKVQDDSLQVVETSTRGRETWREETSSDYDREKL